MRDPYLILGVERAASRDDIKRAYRALAKQYHPDIAPRGSDTSILFQELNSAYDLLYDPGKRARFDRGEINADGNPSARARRADTRTRAYKSSQAAADNHGNNWQGFRAWTGEERKSKSRDKSDAPKDTWRAWRGSTDAKDKAAADPEPDKKTKQDDVLNDFFSGFRSKPKPQIDADGEDVLYKLTISFEESARGATKRVKMPNERRLDVKIPAGVVSGQQIRLRRQGEPGHGTGAPGDALIEIAVALHEKFERDGDDVRLCLPVTIDEAILGAKVIVPTLDGPVTMAIPPNSNTDTTFRLKGKGFPKQSKETARPLGDQYVSLKVVLPPKDDEDFARLVKKWAAKNPYDVRADFA